MSKRNICSIVVVLVPFCANAAEEKTGYTVEAKFIQMPARAEIAILGDSVEVAKDASCYGPNVEIRAGGKSVVRANGEKLDIDAVEGASRGLDVLAAPRVTVVAGQEAAIRIGTTGPHYFVPAQEGTYRHMRVEEDIGTDLKVIVDTVPGDPGRAALSLDFSLREIVGREPLPGVDLDVGPPIVRSREMKTTVTTRLGEWLCLGTGTASDGQGPTPRHGPLFILVRVVQEKAPAAAP
jgi:hypothetical protein